MAKLTLSDLTNLQNETSAVAAINANNAAIEAALEKTLSRDGTSPNTMTADLDMNSKRILNLPAAASPNEPVRKAEFDAATDGFGDFSAEIAAAQAAADDAETARAAAVVAQLAAEAAAAASQAGTVADNAVTNAKMADNAVGTTEIIADAVTNAKLANMTANTMKARKTGSTGDPEDCTITEYLDAAVGNTRGSSLVRKASEWDDLALGAAGTVATSDGTDVVWSANSANPTGTVIAFAANTAPTGYLECDGTAVSRTTYAALFAVVGTTWGTGNGSTTFNLPDFRGEWLRGWDHGRGVDSGRAFASAQSEMIGPHNHTATSTGSTSSDGAHTHTIQSYDSGGATAGLSVRTDGAAYSTPTTSSNGAHTHTLTITTTVNNNSGTENRVRNKAIMYCIKT